MASPRASQADLRLHPSSSEVPWPLDSTARARAHSHTPRQPHTCDTLAHLDTHTQIRTHAHTQHTHAHSHTHSDLHTTLAHTSCSTEHGFLCLAQTANRLRRLPRIWGCLQPPLPAAPKRREAVCWRALARCVCPTAVSTRACSRERCWRKSSRTPGGTLSPGLTCPHHGPGPGTSQQQARLWTVYEALLLQHCPGCKCPGAWAFPLGLEHWWSLPQSCQDLTQHSLELLGETPREIQSSNHASMKSRWWFGAQHPVVLTIRFIGLYKVPTWWRAVRRGPELGDSGFRGCPGHPPLSPLWCQILPHRWDSPSQCLLRGRTLCLWDCLTYACLPLETPGSWS